MIGLDTIVLHGQRLSSGEFFLWAIRDDEWFIDPQRLKWLLFAWDRRSFYGTLIETADWDGKPGLLLSPYDALLFFADPPSVSHVTIQWEEELLLLEKVARIYRQALVHSWFAPSFKKWKAGRLAWKVRIPETEPMLFLFRKAQEEADRLGISYLNEWFDLAVRELVQQESEVAESWEKVLQDHRVLGTLPIHSGEGLAHWVDEEDWLVSIGWKSDETPFRTGVQLVEPEEDEMWRLHLILQDRQDPHRMVEIDWKGNPLEGDVPDHWLPWVQQRVEKDVSRLGRILPWLEGKDSADSLLPELDDDQAWHFLNQGSLDLIQAGYSVFLPSWWEELKASKPKLKAKIQSSVGGAGNALFGLDQLMQFDWKMAVGDMELSEEEFSRIVTEKKRLMRIHGRWVQLDPAFLAQVQQTVKRLKKKGLSLRDVLEMQLLQTGGEEPSVPDGKDKESVSPTSGGDASLILPIELELNRHLRRFIKGLQQVDTLPLVDTPDELNAQLRKYQQEGMSWLLFLRQYGLGACLADDMGLGKTIQFIAYLLCSRKEKGNQPPSLLICPTSVLGNWQKELQKFAPSLQVYLHYGGQRVKGDDFAEKVTGYDLVVTSYTLANMDQADLAKVNWDTLCLDEAQHIKNAHTKQRAAIRTLNARHRIALTGTPIENRLTELWSIFDFLNPGYLGSLRGFTQNYVHAIEKKNDPQFIAKVQKLIRPFLLRRVKKDPAIQLDLPEKNEMKTYVSLTAEQGALYENVVGHLFEKMDSLTGMEKKGLILATLTKLKQICNHPSLFLKESLHPTRNLRSNKVARLLEMVEELRDRGDKCLIFTQFVEMGHLLQEILEAKMEEPVLFLHGGLSKYTRDQMIARFQDSSPVEQGDAKGSGIFILSLKAGGTGLNLTAANHVFHFDRWWNPAVEDQATDRAFRIGQNRDVQVHKFVTLGTLEERIDEMIERKQSLSRQIVGGGENWITEMSTEELKELFTLRKEWVGK